MVADMLSNNKLNSMVAELFIWGKNISLVFSTQSYFALPEDIRLYYTHYFIMKIPNKQEFKVIASQNTLDNDFQDFISLYKKCNKKPYSSLAIDNTLACNNLLLFRKNLIGKILKLIMTIDDKIRDEKLLYNINRWAAKISPISSVKIDTMNEYLTGEEIFLPDQRRVIEQAEFAYSHLGKAFAKLIKTIEN